jgi:hypothetical protein
MLSHHLKAHAEGLFAHAAILARPITEPRIDHDGVSDDDVLHRRAHGFDLPGGVGADDPRRLEGHPGQASQQPQVQMVERRRAYPDEHVPWALELGLREVIADGELLETAVGRERERFQTVGPL